MSFSRGAVKLRTCRLCHTGGWGESLSIWQRDVGSVECDVFRRVTQRPNQLPNRLPDQLPNQLIDR